MGYFLTLLREPVAQHDCTPQPPNLAALEKRGQNSDSGECDE